MARRGRPRARQVVQAVPMDAVDAAGEQFSRPEQAKLLHFLRAEGRNAYFRNPYRTIGHGAHFFELRGPLMNLPMVPVERKAMHRDDVHTLERAVAIERLDEARVDW